MLSVTLKAAGIAPSANNRFPAPKVIGYSKLAQRRPKDVVIIWRRPPAIREAVAGILLSTARSLYDTIKGNMFKHSNSYV
jgi:hypothetical protein